MVLHCVLLYTSIILYSTQHIIMAKISFTTNPKTKGSRFHVPGPPFELRARCAEHVPTPWDTSDTPGTRDFLRESQRLHVWKM